MIPDYLAKSYRYRITGLIENLLGVKIHRSLPHGADLFHDVKQSRAWPFQGAVLDVGAHVGQTALRFAHAFPDAPIFSFEPVSATFTELERRTQHLDNVRCVKIGMGAESRTSRIHIFADSSFNSLEAQPARDSQMEDVTIDTVDRFIQRSGFGRISLLKVDTEGYDLRVVEGAEKAIRSKKVDAILVEAGIEETEKFTPLNVFRSYFDERGYTLHGIYDQAVRDEGLRRCNALFLPRHDAV